MRRPAPFLALFLPLLAPTLLGAQNVVVDEGAFRLSLQGRAVGREEFAIRRVGMGEQARLVLRGTSEADLPTGARNLVLAVDAVGAEMEVSNYQVKVSGAESSEIYVSRSGRRFLAKIVSAQGEELREFRAGPGSVVLEEEAAHQYFLLGPLLNGGADVSLSVLSPLLGRQYRMTLSFIGDEETRVGASLVTARHYRLEADTGTRDLWLDGQGRVLRLEIPSRGFVAEREVLP